MPSPRAVLTFRALLAVVLAVFASASPAVARQDDADAPPAPEAVTGAEVRMTVETFGVGNIVRPGELTGFRIALTDTSDKPREVAVRVRFTDADGDTAVYQRAITLNPQRPVGVWLYGRLPWDISRSSVITFSVNLAQPTGDGALEIGRQIGALRVSAGSAQATLVSSETALAGVVGRRGLGLEHYTQNIGGEVVAASGHEPLRVVTDLAPLQFPDQWHGWAGFETIVWSQGDPAELEGDLRAAALIEWVHRGGHLVITLPAVGNPWESPRNPLASILPRAAHERAVEVDLNKYAALLTLDVDGATRALPSRADLHRFKLAPDAELAEAIPLITGPDGCIAVRRLVGVGMVTLIGIDLNNPAVATAVRADAFWNRILGRRIDQITPAQAENARWRLGGVGLGAPGSVVDASVNQLIATSREASWGILLGLIVFSAYWLIAGPLGFAMLKSRGLERHAWLGFFTTAALFTVVAWAGAAAMRPKKAQEWHYTILDHVYGQPVQSARSFHSILLPEYGEQTVTLGDPGVEAPWRQALAPWADPAADSGLSFPDARDYVADVRNLTSLTVPARSTIKQFQAEWVGGPRWSTPVPRSPQERPARDPSGNLTGVLVHDLPAPLTNVQVILVGRQTSEAEDRALAERKVLSRLRFHAWAWARPDPWAPGEPLDLSSYSNRTSATEISGLLRDRVPTVSITGQLAGSGQLDADRGELAAALFTLLEPPDYTERRSMGTTTRATMRRILTHGLDLGAWFTQPCLIIIGAVQGEPSPVPMAVDGAKLDGQQRPSTGRTVLRWVYPLDPAPVRFGSAPTQGGV